jgi:hypothetical protein
MEVGSLVEDCNFRYRFIVGKLISMTWFKSRYMVGLQSVIKTDDAPEALATKLTNPKPHPSSRTLLQTKSCLSTIQND